MALMSPATTEADVDRHTEVFDEAARRADRWVTTGAIRLVAMTALVARLGSPAKWPEWVMAAQTGHT